MREKGKLSLSVEYQLIYEDETIELENHHGQPQ